MERTARHDHFIGIGNMVDDDRLSASSVATSSLKVYTCEHPYKKRGPATRERCQTANQPQGGPLMVAKSNAIYCTTPESRTKSPTSARAFGFDRQAVRL